VGFVAVTAIWYSFSELVSVVQVAEAIIAAMLFFGAIIVFATWVIENFFKGDD
jgi:hypothetical protein